MSVLSRRVSLAAALAAVACCNGSYLQAQSENNLPVLLTSAKSEPSSLLILDELSELPSDTASDVETVRERYPDGKVRIERQVAMDKEGNYINHGSYQEWSPKGEPVFSGSYREGKREGAWVRVCQQRDSKLFETYPYSKFKAPFQSSVEFHDGEMDGIWTITDADNRMVSQIQLVQGFRDGQSTWFHPSGQVLYQADYKEGILDGMFIEKSAEGKIVRDEKYTTGQRIEVTQQYHAAKALKSEKSYLTAAQSLIKKDDFEKLEMADYSPQGKPVEHGPFVEYHKNGQAKAKGRYSNGKLDGAFESWHANGQKATSGTYRDGLQDDKWIWWFENGMRQATASYVQGKVDGELMAWNEQGKRIQNAKAPEFMDAPQREIPVSKQTPKQNFR